jgi:hypothetical protein
MLGIKGVRERASMASRKRMVWIFKQKPGTYLHVSALDVVVGIEGEAP